MNNQFINKTAAHFRYKKHNTMDQIWCCHCGPICLCKCAEYLMIQTAEELRNSLLFNFNIKMIKRAYNSKVTLSELSEELQSKKITCEQYY